MWRENVTCQANDYDNRRQTNRNGGAVSLRSCVNYENL